MAAPVRRGPAALTAAVRIGWPPPLRTRPVAAHLDPSASVGVATTLRHPEVGGPDPDPSLPAGTFVQVHHPAGRNHPPSLDM